MFRGGPIEGQLPEGWAWGNWEGWPLKNVAFRYAIPGLLSALSYPALWLTWPTIHHCHLPKATVSVCSGLRTHWTVVDGARFNQLPTTPSLPFSPPDHPLAALSQHHPASLLLTDFFSLPARAPSSHHCCCCCSLTQILRLLLLHSSLRSRFFSFFPSLPYPLPALAHN